MSEDSKLSSTARETFIDSRNTLYLSLASAWEMAIKSNLKKLKLPLPVTKYIATRTKTHRINLLEITLEHVSAVENLPQHHRDPFDRLLISQCLAEKLPILTADRMFDAYPVERIW